MKKIALSLIGAALISISTQAATFNVAPQAPQQEATLQLTAGRLIFLGYVRNWAECAQLGRAAGLNTGYLYASEYSNAYKCMAIPLQ